MTSRFIALFACGLGLAVACGSSDDDNVAPGDDAGGAPADAGAPPVAAAGSSTTPGGSGGKGGSGGSAGTGGALTTPGGAAGETSAAGAASAGGPPNEPSEPGVSACGADKYETGEGCDDCPALPAQNDATNLTCQNFSRAYNADDEYLELSFAQVPFHEPLGGTVTLDWDDTTTTTLPGSAEVSWTYSAADQKFLVTLPVEARYADTWSFGTWTFTDVCGFIFSANLTIRYASDAYTCQQPT